MTVSCSVLGKVIDVVKSLLKVLEISYNKKLPCIVYHGQ